MAFDPDAYLAKKAGKARGGFDPDAYIAGKKPKPDRTEMLAKMAAEDEAGMYAPGSTPEPDTNYLKEIARQTAGTAYGVGEAVSPVNLPKGLEILGRAVLTESGGPFERLQKASEKSVIPGQEEVAAGLRALVPDEGESGMPFRERYKREMQAQEELIPEVAAPEGRLLGNFATALYGLIRGGQAVAKSPKVRGLLGKISKATPDEPLPKPGAVAEGIPDEALKVAQADDLVPDEAAKALQVEEPKQGLIAKVEELKAGALDDFDNVPQTSKIQKADPTPKPTIQDKAIANARKVSAPEASADDVAYFKKYQERIRSGPSLDENAPNPMSNDVLQDLDNFQSYIDNKEAIAANLIENSDFSMTTGDVAKIFKKQIQKLQGSGGKYAKSNKAAIAELQSYVESLVSDGDNVVLSPRQVRQLMQGLWKDNKMAFVPGREPTVAENAVSKVTSTMNQILKRGVGKEYASHMKDYAPEVAALRKLQKEWKIDASGVPQMNGWFKNRMVYHFQEAEFGNRPATDPMLRAISVMGDRVGKNYASMIKDQLVFGRMFPDEAKGMQGGTATSWWTRAAKRGLSPKGWFEEAIRSGTEKVAERPLRKTPKPSKGGLAEKVTKPRGEK
jgi:hypothetical protein